MGKFSKTVKSMVDVPRWMGASLIKDSAKNIKDVVGTLFVPTKPQREETYEQAIQRMALTEDHLAQRKKRFLLGAAAYGTTGLLFLSYTVYLLVNQAYVAVMLSTVLSLVAFSLAFRDHFWYFQMHERRLGCSVKEWYQFLIRRR